VTSQPGPGPRAVAQTGEGVYVGVLDTGLLHTWRLYFPEERIATEYAKAVSGGWHPNASNPETPNVWEQDVGGHGTHVTSTIIGYDFLGTPINGVAPKATVIPVKVLGQRGSGWVSMIAEGLVYVAGLKAGPLNGNPVVVNMSLGTAAPAALMRVAVDFAIANGVIVVSSAGNEGAEGMSYPAAYEPVISVASAGWGDCLTWPDVTSTSECFGQWTTRTWWNSRDVFENTVDQFYISDFSSRALEDQDLDVVAPGDGVVGPFQLDRSVHADYFFLRGTSMASPHVAGIVALMAEKHPGLSAAQAEAILEGAAQPMAPGTHHPLARGPACCFELSWEDDATGHGFITADAALAGTP
ncbi:MAG: S8 family peptidase, partial [Longimicrobiales bacterium]